MKHIKIAFTLTLTVVLSMVAVFLVEAYTTPIIDDYNERLANDALYSIMSEFDGTFEDVTSSYSLDDSSIVQIYEAGTEGIIYKASFQGFGSIITYMIGVSTVDSSVYGVVILEQNDTPGYGANIANPDYVLQFLGIEQELVKDGDIDGLTGASITTGSFFASLSNVITFHEVNFGGVVAPTEAEVRAEMMDDLFPGAAFTSVKDDYEASDAILNIYEAKIDGVLVGYAYLVEGVGAIAASGLPFEYYIGINLDKTYTSLRMYENNDTASYIAPYLEVEFGDTYDGVALGDESTIDGFTAATSQSRATIIQSTEYLMAYHITKVLGEVLNRPDPVDNANIFRAFDVLADSYTSIYSENVYQENILNVYELKDNLGTVIGYIYYGNSYGYGGEIQFAIGVDLTNTTDNFIILSTNETWDQAYPYSGGEVFPDTTWLQNYEDVTIASLFTDPLIDGISGVSTTTGTRGLDNGLIFAIESILQYHLDNIGGAE
ncbi:MAG: FMN-binding protein [Candidatus Izemoplasma sp.]